MDTADHMLKLRLELAYDGTDFAGWAIQPGLRTVQGEVEAALTQVLRLPQPVRVFVAGRTDARVHARAQVAHVIIPSALWPVDGEARILRRLRVVLPRDILVRSISPVSMDFDARFSATFRRYSYTIADGPQRWDPLRRVGVLWHKHELDLDLLNAASQLLLGLNDFAAFCKARPESTTIRELRTLAWTRSSDSGLLRADIVADAFCHNMVRSLVGSLLEIGGGRKPIDWISQVLASKDRAAAGSVAAAEGLVLEEVGYGQPGEWAGQNMRTRARRE